MASYGSVKKNKSSQDTLGNRNKSFWEIEFGSSKLIPGKLKVPQADLLVFFRQLSVILKSGVPLAQGLELLSENVPNK